MNYMQQPPPDALNPMNYYAGTPLVNVNQGHSRVFGNYPVDGSPLLFADDIGGFGVDDGEHGDPKRRRIARACDMCRKKKIKCDGKLPACTHCQNYKTECVFTQVEKKRNPPKGAKYIEGLENRLGRMESLLRLSGLLSDDDPEAADLGTLEKKLADKTAALSKENGGSSGSITVKETSPTTDGKPSEASPTLSGSTPDTPKPGRTDEEVEALSDMMCSLVTNNCGETRYIGSSSGFSIFSPKGIQWVNEKTGDSSFQTMISTTALEETEWIHWKHDVFRDIFQRRVYKQLPPKAEAESLLKDYFENFNCMFPLFHEPTFMHLVDKQYSREPYDGSGWWASLNVALAIAHRLRVMSNLVPQEEDQNAWGYLKNALAVQTELTMRNTDLLSVQALLGMALFLQGTPNPQPSFFLVAAAIRLAHSMGLHKRGSGFVLNPSEIEQRKRVFWIAYMLDKDICLRAGRPPIQDDDDMNVELPSEDPPDNVGNIPLADGKGKVNLFKLMCTFALISSKVYKQLYSVKASKQSDGELLNTIGELDRELEEWKDSIPIDFRPEHEIKASHTPLILHVVVLHFAYYNCLTTIHRMSVHHGYWTSRLSNYAIQGLNARPLNPRVFSSAALCVSAARASIHLIKYVPHGDYSCVWMILYYPVSSLVTLFANILQNPHDSRARSDLKLMNHVVNFLSTLCTGEEAGGVRRMLSVCSEFERVSKVVLDKADKDSSSRRKRKQSHQDSSQPTKSGEDGDKVSSPGDTSPSQQQGEQASQQQKGAPTTPKPSVPGNIPKVFSPPQVSAYLNDDNTQSGFSSISQSLSSANSKSTQSRPGWSNTNRTSPAIGSGDKTTPGASTFDFISSSPSATSHSRPSMSSLSGFSADQPTIDPLDLGNAFQHPFVPQDLWQMPMTLEWDWADMTSGFSSLEGTGVSSGLGDIASPPQQTPPAVVQAASNNLNGSRFNTNSGQGQRKSGSY